MRGKYPDAFAGKAAEVRAWHSRQMDSALQGLDWFAARFHVSQLLRLQPGDAEWERKRREIETAVREEPAPGNSPDALTKVQSRISPRDPRAQKGMVDLSTHYNRTLTEEIAHGWEHEGENLSDLPRGLQEVAGVRFDLRGLIVLLGIQFKASGRSAPEGVKDIKFGGK